MVRKEGAEPASKYKIEKNAIIYGRTSGTHRAATPNVPNQAPMPQASKQLLNECAVPPMYIMIILLAGCQSSILSANEWHYDMNPACLSTIMTPNFKMEGITDEKNHTHPK